MASGSIQVKSGMYYIVTYFKDSTGRRKQKWTSTGLKAIPENKKKAELVLTKQEKRVESLKYDLAKYAEDWINSIEYVTDPITFQGYKSAIDLHIVPYFKTHPMRILEATPNDISEFQAFIIQHGNTRTGGALSAKSVRNFMAVLSLIFEDAISKELIDSNPVKKVKRPPKKAPQMHFYSVEQTRRLFEAVSDHRLGDLIIIATIYGLRKSEVLGLKWDAIDFENKRVTIKRTVVRLYDYVEKETTKNKSSYRTYPLLPIAEDIFKRQLSLEKRCRLKFGDRYNECGYVFKWDNGKPYAPRYINEAFCKLLEENDLPPIRFHDLRNSCASMLIEQGRNLKDVQVWLGHSDIRTTGNIYGHLTNRHLEEVGSKLTDELFS